MYYYTYNTHILAAAGIVGILVIAVVLTALLAVLVLPKHKDGKLPAFFQLLFDAFTPKTLLLEKILQVKATREINRKLSFLVPEGAAQAAEEEDLPKEPEAEAPAAKSPTQPPLTHCPSCGTWYQEALGKCPVCGRAHEKDES